MNLIFIIDEVVEKYLRCGDLHYGFVRIRCEEYGAEYLRAFLCKCRGYARPAQRGSRLTW
ncbi:MAG: transposase zinc-binding domain-containing protein [Candidatus Aegiribacteria sp.]|nr:transposase zinc-binding domain-containing protein [Candidatus Aegiribacteria sp.]